MTDIKNHNHNMTKQMTPKEVDALFLGIIREFPRQDIEGIGVKYNAGRLAVEFFFATLCNLYFDPNYAPSQSYWTIYDTCFMESSEKLNRSDFLNICEICRFKLNTKCQETGIHFDSD